MSTAAPEPKPSLARQVRQERDQLRKHLLSLRDSSLGSSLVQRIKSRKAKPDPEQEALQSRMDLRATRYMSASEMSDLIGEEIEPEDPGAECGTVERAQDAFGGPLCDLCPAYLMREVIDTIPALVWAKRIPDGLMLLCNEPAAEMGGTTRAKMEGTMPEQWWPRRDCEKWKIDDNEVASTGRPKRGILETIVHPKSGQVRWLRTDKQPVIDHSGKVFAVLVFSYDVTDILPPEMRNTYA